MRRNRFNNGRSPILPNKGGKLWRFKTGKGIFSTPVIGHDQTILVGSADRFFYAIDPDGQQKWRLETGEIIDSAAAVAKDGTIYVPSGDGNLYALTPEGEELWRFTAQHMKGDPLQHEGTSCCRQRFGPLALCHLESGTSNWFEGNVVIGKDGMLWAGNDNHRMYGISPTGQAQTVFWPAHWIGFATVWTAAATLSNGDVLFGSLNSHAYNITADGQCNWRRELRQLSINDMITSSPALSNDEKTAYMGSWDKNLYALDTRSGKIKWQFLTDGHIYSSPAVTKEGSIIFASTDGTVYALDPDGQLLWSFATLDPIRSSPAVAGDGTIYIGSGDGILYALDQDGKRRWSFDTTTEDRNDLNSSPALGLSSIYIGGENGYLHAIPYSYCESNPRDRRCNLNPKSDLARSGAEFFYVTTGGRTLKRPEGAIQRAAALTFRLVVSKNQKISKAKINFKTFRFSSEPEAHFDIIEAADPQIVHLVPKHFLDPSTSYAITLTADYEVPASIGQETVTRTFTFQTIDEDKPTLDLDLGEHRVPAWEIQNLAPYQPAMLLSLNQIGFDSVNFLSSVIHRDDDRAIMWFTSGLPANDHTRIDPEAPTIGALQAQFDGSSFRFEGSHFNLVTGGPLLSIANLEISSQFDNGFFDQGTSFYASSPCSLRLAKGAGYLLRQLNQCNPQNELTSFGTIRGKPYLGHANHRPTGIQATRIYRRGGRVLADIQASDFAMDAHISALVLYDRKARQLLPMDYSQTNRSEKDAHGNLARVILKPRGQINWGHITAILVTDLFPIQKQRL